MSDRLHDHETFGIRRGCVACAQFEADFRLAQKAFWAKHAAKNPDSQSAPHVTSPLSKNAPVSTRS